MAAGFHSPAIFYCSTGTSLAVRSKHYKMETGLPSWFRLCHVRVASPAWVGEVTN
jgi:hypothetical protein